MRLTATVLAASLAAVLLAAPPALADGPRRPDNRPGVQKQELQHVQSKIQSLRHQIRRAEEQFAHAQQSAKHVGSAAHSERLQQLDCKIGEAETRLVELREGRGYTEFHPDVKSSVAVLTGLRRLRQTEVNNAQREAAAHRARMTAERAGGHGRLSALRSELDRLTSTERNLVASMSRPKPAKVKKAPPMDGARDRARDGSRDGGRRVRAQPGVEDRLARLEKAVSELVHMVKEREKVAREKVARDRVTLQKAMAEREAGQGRRGRDGAGARGGRGGEGGGVRGGRGGERGPDAERGREHALKLQRALDGEREESQALRKAVKHLEQRLVGERAEAEGLRDLIRRMKAERGEGGARRLDEVVRALEGERAESEELREIVRQLELRARAERTEADELRKALQRSKRGEPGDSAKLRRTVEELQKRVRVQVEEAEDLRERMRRVREKRAEEGHGEERHDGPDDAEARELRGHVRGLERRLQVMQHENRELREVVEELESKLETLRAKLERR